MASSFRRPQLNIQPFSGDENILDEPTDFILGSNDGYLFHAHERQMRLVSGFFESALGSNPPPQMDVRIIDIYTVALHNKYLFNLINPALIENILVTWIDKEPARVYAIAADKFHELYRYRDMCSKQCIDYLQELSRPIKYDDDQNPCMKFFWHPTEWFILHIRAVVDVVRQTMDIEKITQAMCYPNAEALVVLSQCSKCMQGAYKDLGTQAGKMAQELEQ
ncbi:hypothetical protein C8J56DRAFT_958789 [Mycena floridula]|nr:hypothetical protein C8J56DRAFT_958789 [Mycena floridula]